MEELEKWFEKTEFKTTKDVPIPERFVDQVIGQDESVEVIKKAAQQKRHVMLIGEPGTGKSMLAKAMAEILPKDELQDVIVYPNPEDPNAPKIKAVPAGKGKSIVGAERAEALRRKSQKTSMFMLIIFMIGCFFVVYFIETKNIMILFYGIIASAVLFWVFWMTMARGPMMKKDVVPKLLVSHKPDETPPFVEATGAHAGALLGDVRHDPFQCILAQEKLHLANGKPIPVARLLDPYFVGLDENVTEVDLNKPLYVLGGYDRSYGYMQTKAVRVYRRKYGGNIVEVETERGVRISVTPNHPTAVFAENGDIIYVPAGELSGNEYCVVPEKLPISVWEEQLSEPPLLLLADILADGHIGKRSVQFKLRRDFKIKSILGDIRRAGYVPKVRIKDNTTFININSVALVKLLETWGAKAHGKKEVPSIIFNQPGEKIKKFVIRYFSLDGYVGRQGQFELVSKEMIPDFVALLLKIGVRVKVREREDRGFGKERGTIQQRIIFGDYEFAREYYAKTINPYHKHNLSVYLSTTRFKHVAPDDVIPISFKFLESIRDATGLSKTLVHKAYYSLNPDVDTHAASTRPMLSKVCKRFIEHTNCPKLFKLRDIVEGTYAFSKIKNIRLIHYDGYVYNLTTETGNYIVNNILTHNSGGLETPPHERVEPGAIHRAHKGVLFIDEINTLRLEDQQNMLTALQEKSFPISGQSERSAGALVKTEVVPCDFILVVAGNLDAVQGMHPALRSRIRGYGYEIYMRSLMDDNEENRQKLIRFVAQEIKKDTKIPHFDRGAVLEVLKEAQRRAGCKGKLSLRLRELGGLIRVAGDIAVENYIMSLPKERQTDAIKNAKEELIVSSEHVFEAKRIAKSLEQQVADRFIEKRKEYKCFRTEGSEIGMVNGLAVMGADTGMSEFSGIILPIVAEVTPAHSRAEGKIIATGKLGDIAKEAVQNVSALIKKYTGKDISNHDVHIQFIGTYEGVEGDSASISVATAVISALESVNVDQCVGMTGSLSIRGEVLPVGGITAKIEAAAEAGLKKILIPSANLKDVFITEKYKNKIEIIPVETLKDVLDNALVGAKKKSLVEKLSALVPKRFALPTPTG